MSDIYNYGMYTDYISGDIVTALEIPNIADNYSIILGDKSKLIISKDYIEFKKEDGSVIVVDDKPDFIYAVNYILRDNYCSYQKIYKSEREKMFHDIMLMVGIDNERYLKLLSLFNDKNV